MRKQKNKNKGCSDWTIVFNFPDGMSFPLIDGSFTTSLTPDVRTWETEEEAEEYAKTICGKYSWVTFPTKTTITIY